MAPGPGCGECTAPRTGPGDMPLALRLSDGLGHAGAAARDWENAEASLTSRHGADHIATTAGDERHRLGLRAPRSCEGRNANIPALAKRDGVDVGRLFFISSVRHRWL